MEQSLIQDAKISPKLQDEQMSTNILSDTNEHHKDATSDLVIVDWDGPNDAENPMNWAARRKMGAVILVSALTFLGAMASTIFAPGVPSLMQHFNSDDSQIASFTVSVYAIGFCIGPLVISPFSEHYGRNLIYHGSNIFFLIFSIICATSTNFSMFIVFRFLQGLAGALPITLGGGTVADLYAPERRGTPMSIWTLGPFLGPVVGPVSGGFIAESLGWRWIFWIVVIITSVFTLVSFIYLRETYPPTLLERKAQNLRKLSGNDTKIRSRFDSGQTARQLFISAIVRPSKMLTRSPIAFILAIYMGLVYGYMYILYTTFTPVFTTQYGFSIGTVGLSYLGLGIGFVLGQILVGLFADRYLHGRAKRSSNRKTEPEQRLPPLAVGVFLIPVGFIWYGWSINYKVPWIVPILGTCCVGMGCVCAFLSSQMYLVDAFGIFAASATAANTFVRSLVAAILPLAGGSLYGRLGYGWGNMTLAFVALAFGPVPFLLMKYGQRVRADPRFQPKL